MITAAIILGALAISTLISVIWLTGVALRYALHMDMVDRVNDRSSHVAATPRGGGVAIVTVFLVALGLATIAGLIPRNVTFGLTGGGLIVAGIGWLDDHGHVSFAVRLLAHFVGAIWAVAWIGMLPLDLLPLWQSAWGVPTAIVSVLFVVWMVNLYNFMDGIDGIAAGEAVSVAIGGSITVIVAGWASPASLAAPILLAAASLGFLVWNWPPARIFMGDTSSGFLGLAFGALTLAAGTVSRPLAFAWIVLLGVFVADATVTLGHRLVKGERLYEAHRSHSYQRLARSLGKHRPVTLGAIALTSGWCLPIACCIAASLIAPILGLLIAYVPLCGFVLWLGARDVGDDQGG